MKISFKEKRAIIPKKKNAFLIYFWDIFIRKSQIWGIPHLQISKVMTFFELEAVESHENNLKNSQMTKYWKLGRWTPFRTLPVLLLWTLVNTSLAWKIPLWVLPHLTKFHASTSNCNLHPTPKIIAVCPWTKQREREKEREIWVNEI